jgi:hypothetical protein
MFYDQSKRKECKDILEMPLSNCTIFFSNLIFKNPKCLNQLIDSWIKGFSFIDSKQTPKEYVRNSILEILKTNLVLKIESEKILDFNTNEFRYIHTIDLFCNSNVVLISDYLSYKELQCIQSFIVQNAFSNYSSNPHATKLICKDFKYNKELRTHYDKKEFVIKLSKKLIEMNEKLKETIIEAIESSSSIERNVKEEIIKSI